MSKYVIEAYTDGACEPNPGVGAWGVVLVARDVTGKVVRTRELSGYMGDEQTNQRAEIQAVIGALNALTEPCKLTVYTDSMYVVNCASGHWGRNANRDLWADFDLACMRHDVSFKHVKGHAGHHFNERADALATLALLGKVRA